MTMFFITLPLMVAAVAIAVVPVLYHSIREHRLIQAGSADPVGPRVDAGPSALPEPSPERERVAA
jgi:hypothetical protein